MPALITEEQYALAQQLLERNSRLSPRNTRRPSLLQGILVCRECGHSYYRSSTRSKTGNVHHYYRCSGADSFRRPEGRVCAARPVRIDEIDELVWAQVLALLENPELIKAEIDRRLQALRAEHPASHRRDGLQRDLTRAQSALRRLIDGYQEQLITLEELRARTPELRKREATLRAELDALDAQLHDAETYLKLTETLDAFRARLSANAEKLTIEQRQEIVRLVVREVLLGDDDITVRHSIPVPAGGQPGGSLLRSQSQGAAQGDQGRVRRARAGAPLSSAQGAQCLRSAARTRPAADPCPDPRRVGADRPRSRQASGSSGSPAELDRTWPDAAASLREGMDDTLTLMRLGIDGQLAKTLSSTNPCESMIEIVRYTQRNVKRWQDGDMRKRWTAAGMLVAEQQFRRIIGYQRSRQARDRDRATCPPHCRKKPRPSGDPRARYRVTINPRGPSPKFHDDPDNLARPAVALNWRRLPTCSPTATPSQIQAPPTRRAVDRQPPTNVPVATTARSGVNGGASHHQPGGQADYRRGLALHYQVHRSGLSERC